MTDPHDHREDRDHRGLRFPHTAVGAAAGDLHGHGHGHGRDDHGHSDDDRGHASGLRGWIASVFRPHGHDAADSVDAALESSAEGIRALKISLVALGVTAMAQLVVVLYTGSVAVLADTIHNFADALTAVPLWIAFVLGRRAATRRYTYGYGRAEDLAGVFIVAMIALSAALAGVRVDPPPAGPPADHERGCGAGRRAHRLRRQRTGRGLPDPGRTQDRLRGAGRRRPTRPY
jgi:hypothetical protein